MFSPQNNTELKFRLTIWPKVKGKYGQEYLKVGLFAYRVPAAWEGKLTVKEIRSIEDEEGRKIFTKGTANGEIWVRNCRNSEDVQEFLNIVFRIPGYGSVS